MRGGFLGVALVCAACGGATSVETGVADDGDDPDASRGSGGRAGSGDAGLPPPAGAGGARSTGGASNAGGASNTGGAPVCSGTLAWNVTKNDLGIREGMGCFQGCDRGDGPCPAGKVCVDAPGCDCADATACEACYSKWLCTDASPARCGDLTTYASSHVRFSGQVLCSTDADCVEVSSDTACSSSCNIAVTRATAATVAEAIDEANAKWCGVFRDLGCPLLFPDCSPNARVGCFSGKCGFETPPDRYAYDVVDVIDSGDRIAVAKADFERDACIVAEFFVQVGDPVPRFERAFAKFGTGACCPLPSTNEIGQCNPDEPAFCDWYEASPGGTTGTANLDSARLLDVDYSIYFNVYSDHVALKVTDLPVRQCGRVP